jgi:hypothetical protein
MTATLGHNKAMKCLMTFFLSTKDEALLINAQGKWNGKMNGD